MNEASFSKWLVGHFRDQGAFVQRLEVTTGSGVPDLVVIHKGRTHWVELKWNTNHIRPEQAVWANKAAQSGILVDYLCGADNDITHYVSHNYMPHWAEPMTNTFKLTLRQGGYYRKKEAIPELLSHLRR